MRVLYVNHTRQKSGAGISLSTLLHGLPPDVEQFFLLPSGCEITDMLGAAPDRTYYERRLCQFMTTLYTPQYRPALFMWHLIKFPIAVRRIKWLVRRWKIDLVHVNETSLLAYAFGARAAGVPVVLHARTALANRPFEHFLLRRLCSLPRVQIAAIDGEVKASLPPPCRAVSHVIYNPIDLGPEPSANDIRAMRASWGCGSEHVIVGQVASLHPQKGIWLILELAEKLCAEFPRLRFVLVGNDAPEAGQGPELKEAIRKKGLADRIILPGYHSQLSLVYAAMDVALCLFGGLGGVGRGAYEAALAGKPLVATLPDPEVSETLQNRVTALLSRPEDKAGIFQSVRELVASPSLREKLGTTARTVIGGRHSPERIVRTMIELYNTLLKST